VGKLTLLLMDETFRFRRPWLFSFAMAIVAAVGLSGLLALDGSYDKIRTVVPVASLVIFFAVRLGVVYETERAER
jgi:hypothetical protein